MFRYITYIIIIMTESIVFNVIEWNEYNDSLEENPEIEFPDRFYLIDLFGRTAKGESVYLRVENYIPYFYIELPDDVNVLYLKNYIENKLGFFKKYFDKKKSDIVKRKKFYYFSGEKEYNFLRLIFTNSFVMGKCVKFFEEKISLAGDIPRKFKVYENNIPPFLRFMHIRKLQSCGWIKVNKYEKFENDNILTDIKIKADWKEVFFHENPVYAKFKILSFDIECISPNGGFPLALNKCDKIIMIGNTFSEYGSDECYKKIMIVVGECDDIDGVEIIRCKTEKDLILEWIDMVQKTNPDVITGYNIIGFDEKYIHDRAEVYGIKDEFFLNKVINKKTEFKKIMLSSSGLGDNEMKYFDIKGRTTVDIMKVVQKDYKLSSYKLDDVSEYFFKYDIIRQIHDNILEVKNPEKLKIGNYIKIEINILGEKLLNKKFKILEINNNILKIDTNIDIYKIKDCKYCLVKDDLPPKDITVFYLTKDPKKIAKVAEYCIQDCVLCNKLMHRLDVLNITMAMATVCNVPLSYIFFRGQGIKAFSLVAKKCREENYIIPLLKKGGNETSFEGADVLPPKVGLYSDPICVVDYGSLYPSSIIEKNLSHETLVNCPLYDNLPGYKYNEVSFRNYSTGDFEKYKFVKKEGKFGIIPQILLDLLQARKNTRKLQAQLKDDPIRYNILEGQQLAYKITANSVYGQTGASMSSIYQPIIAACCTSIGRSKLEFAQKFVVDDFKAIVNDYLIKENIMITPEIIYGDSVLPDTPILVKLQEQILIKEIQDLFIKSNQMLDKEYSLSEYKVWTNFGWTKINKVIRHKTNKKIYRITTNTGSVCVTEDHSLIDENLKLIKPTEVKYDTKLLSSYPKLVKNDTIIANSNIIDAYYLEDEIIYYTKTKLEAAQKYLILKEQYPQISINEMNGMYKLSTKVSQNPIKVEIINEEYDDFVYDLETDAGVFQAGIGDIIVKNTDSNMINFNIKFLGEQQRQPKDKLRMTIELGQLIEKNIQPLLEYPHKLEYEKTYYKYLLLAKKRYAGDKYTFDINKSSRIFSGIELNRRDNPYIVKRILFNILDLMLSEESFKCIEYTKAEINKVLKGFYDIEEFVITKTLKKNYKNRNSQEHVNLADRIAKRDPGNAYQLNDRIPFVYVDRNDKKKVPKFELTEDPKYIKLNNMKINYLLYVQDKIKKPVCRFLKFVTKDAEKLFNDIVIDETNRRRGIRPISFYCKEPTYSESPADEIVLEDDDDINSE